MSANNTTPRPYIVTIQTARGECKESVWAYEILEAMQSALMKVLAAGELVIQVQYAEPDLAEAKKAINAITQETLDLVKIAIRDAGLSAKRKP